MYFFSPISRRVLSDKGETFFFMCLVVFSVRLFVWRCHYNFIHPSNLFIFHFFLLFLSDVCFDQNDDKMHVLVEMDWKKRFIVGSNLCEL